jgi:hypothetical protein
MKKNTRTFGFQRLAAIVSDGLEISSMDYHSGTLYWHDYTLLVINIHSKTSL